MYWKEREKDKRMLAVCFWKMCKVEFYKRHGNQKYCGSTCSEAAKKDCYERNKRVRNCSYCGRPFWSCSPGHRHCKKSCAKEAGKL